MGKTWKDDKYQSGADHDRDDEDLNKVLGKIGQDVDIADDKFDINKYLANYKAQLFKTPGCHQQGRTVFKIGNIPVRAGGYMYEDFKYGAGDTLLVLTKHFKQERNQRMKFSQFVKHVPPTVVKLNWPDYGVPKLDRRAWEGILKKITAPNKPIMVFCDGGHGRTGSALSILYGLTFENENAKEVIGFIRKHYCRKAVETIEQERYVDAILRGVEYKPLPEKKKDEDKWGTAVDIQPIETDDKTFWAWYERTHPGAYKKLQ